MNPSITMASAHQWTGRTLRFLLALLLLSVALPTAGPVASGADRLHASLVQLAADYPETEVRVIVQKRGAESGVESQILQLGGRILQDLSIIDSVSAQIAAGQLHKLAANPAVRWISLDAPMQSADTATITLFPAKDTWISEGNSKQAYGDANYMTVKSASRNRGRGLFWFDLSGIPDDLAIVDAQLTLGMVGAASSNPWDISVHAMLNTQPAHGWTEERASWNDYDKNRDNWSQPGAYGDFNPNPVDVTTIIGGHGGVFSWDVTLLVQQWVGQDILNTGLLLKGAQEGGSANYQANFSSLEGIYPPRLVISYDTGDVPVDGTNNHAISLYLDSMGVRDVWAMGVDGKGVGVAVIDSGITKDDDFASLRKTLSFNPNSTSTSDAYGHGTHVAGIIAGTGYNSGGLYKGVAPGASLYSLKISDETGMAYESDTVAALQWVLENKNKGNNNIRVVNLSINSTLEQSYHTSPLSAAAEILWFNGVVVVAATGNKGPGGGPNTANAAPAHDPFLIAVGASNERGTVDRFDDGVAPFSAHGVTDDGFLRPDIIAPGKDVVSVLARSSQWELDYPERVEMNGEYFRLSGTSMAAPMVTGAVALLLQAEPALTPDQVKYRLLATAPGIKGSNESGGDKNYPYMDVYAALTTPTTGAANVGLAASQMLWTGNEPITWDSVNWNSVNWNSVNWNSVNWNSVNWNSVNWNSVAWEDMGPNPQSKVSEQTPFQISQMGKKVGQIRTGEVISVSVQITNTGDAWLPVLPLRYTYDAAYLRFISASQEPVDGVDDGALDWTSIAQDGGIGRSPNADSIGLAPGDTTTVMLYFKGIEDTSQLESGLTENVVTISGAQSDPDGSAGPARVVAVSGWSSADVGVQVLRPTAVSLASSSLQQDGRDVTIRWQTGDETNVVAFRLLRRVDEAAYLPLQTEWLPAQQAGTSQGSQYEIVDPGLEFGHTYGYRLAILEANGHASTMELGDLSTAWRIYLPMVAD